MNLMTTNIQTAIEFLADVIQKLSAILKELFGESLFFNHFFSYCKLEAYGIVKLKW